jgi:hypothetical protein
MQSLLITTTDTSGMVKEFSYECHNATTAMAIVQGTLQGCQDTGWTLNKVEMI